MFCNCNPLLVASLFVISNALADFLTINWNITKDRSNSHLERDYKYPMYRDVAPVPCDLTTSCDAFCCQDPDCDEYQSSQCPKPSDSCSGSLSFFDCDCYNSNTPEWLFAVCYVYKNPVYLGKFYKTSKKIEEFSVLKKIIQKNSLFHPNQNGGEPKAGLTNQLGSPIMTFVPKSNSFPSVNTLLRMIPLKDSTYACFSGPVNYRINGISYCLTRITPELCHSGYTLSILPYLVQGSNISAYGPVPVVLKNSDHLEGLKTETAVNCVQLKLKKLKFKKEMMNFFHEHKMTACPDTASPQQTSFVNNTCQNILVSAQYQFVLNGSDIVKLKVDYGVTNLTFTNNDENDVKKYIYLKQKFSIKFIDVMHKVYHNQNHSKHDVLNRGYYLGEELNFGYKETKNSSTSWEKGVLAVFGNGASCDTSSPVTFGDQVHSVCRIRVRFPNCSQLRKAAEEKFDALLRGDSLAVYANLRPPYNDTVPLLRHPLSSRSEGNSSEGELKEIPGCEVPAVQEVLIQYTTLPTGSGASVHRILGARVDRTFGNVSTVADVLLTARVSFLYVSPSPDRRLSRFWRRMLSRELSENSWLNILNGFDDPDSAEREEITFWWTALTVSAAVVLACSKVDLRLDSFF